MDAKQPYLKPFLNSDQLCEKLIAQGLEISDVSAAKIELERCSYYRFKAYLYPFQDPDTKRFLESATFEKGLQLYKFDSELRSYLFQVIEKVEIGVRSTLDIWITKESGNPFWYLDSSLFNDNGTQINTVNKLRGMFTDSREEYATHYRNKYFNRFCPFYRDLPPGWVALELMTFGNIQSLMSNLSQSSIQSLKLDRYARKKLGVPNFASIANWMTSIKQVRNACGHHNRLYNRNLSAPSGIKRLLKKEIALVRTAPVEGAREEDQLNRLYTSLAAIQVIYSNLGHNEKIGIELDSLLNKYPAAFLFFKSMGIPENWKEEPILFDNY